MDHIEVLKRAARTVWKYRALWWVGLLLVLAGGSVTSGFGGAPGGASSGTSGEGRPWQGEWGNVPDHRAFSDAWEKVLPILAGAAVLIAVLLVVAVLIGIVKVIARYVTRASLIRMVDQYEETGEQVGLMSGLRLGWSRSAFRLFLISLSLKLPLALLMALSIGGLVTLGVLGIVSESGPGTVLSVVLFLLLIPVGLLGAVIGTVLGPIVEVAYRICAVEKVGAWEAIRSAFGLIRRNLGATALQWLLLVGLGIAWRIALIPVNLLLVLLGVLVGGLPALALGGLGALATSGPLLGIGIGTLAFVPVFLLVVGLPNVALSTVATVFHSTVWTLTYRELTAIDGGLRVKPAATVDDDLQAS
jgi:hypothetical protein